MLKISRRKFLYFPIGVLSFALVNSRQAQSSAQALSESNPQAISLGYKINAASIDRLRWTQFIPGQSCGRCISYQGAPGSSQGPCNILGGQVVIALGWCSLYKAA